MQPVSIYSFTERSLKYAILLIGMTFGTFFLFEIMTGGRVHPIQYPLVGAALAVFYALLLFFGEILGYALAYLGGATAWVMLIGWYVSHVLGGWHCGEILDWCRQSGQNWLILGSVVVLDLPKIRWLIRLENHRILQISGVSGLELQA